MAPTRNVTVTISLRQATSDHLPIMKSSGAYPRADLRRSDSRVISSSTPGNKSRELVPVVALFTTGID